MPTATDPGVALAQASGYTHATIGSKELYPDNEPITFSVLTRLAAQLSAEGILYLVSILQLVMRRHGGEPNRSKRLPEEHAVLRNTDHPFRWNGGLAPSQTSPSAVLASVGAASPCGFRYLQACRISPRDATHVYF
jgi:hypothetical protein